MASQITGVSNPCSTGGSGADQKKNIKVTRDCPLWGESTSDRWIPSAKGQLYDKKSPFDDAIIWHRVNTKQFKCRYINTALGRSRPTAYRSTSLKLRTYLNLRTRVLKFKYANFALSPLKLLNKVCDNVIKGSPTLILRFILSIFRCKTKMMSRGHPVLERERKNYTREWHSSKQVAFSVC